MNPELIESLLLTAQAAKATAEACLLAVQQIQQQQQQPGRMISAAAAMALLGISRTTLHQFRRDCWIEGVHYFPRGRKGALYNADLLLDWQQNRGNEQAHQVAVERWLKGQTVNQRRR